MLSLRYHSKFKISLNFDERNVNSTLIRSEGFQRGLLLEL